jgi:hypothetical protein
MLVRIFNAYIEIEMVRIANKAIGFVSIRDNADAKLSLKGRQTLFPLTILTRFDMGAGYPLVRQLFSRIFRSEISLDR